MLVIDDNGNENRLTIEWDGTVREHGTDDYPHKREDRTFEQQVVMTQVEERAKVAAQREFPQEDILETEWMPEGVQRGVEALQTLDVERFAEDFERCYDMVTHPERFPGVTRKTAQIVWQPFYIDASNTVNAVPEPVIQYKERGEVKTTDPESAMRGYGGDKLTISLPPMVFDEGDYEFPDGFQVFCIEHMYAQLRDIYEHIGETLPEGFPDIDDDFPGRPLTCVHREYYENF
ncbi:hypothetical protein EGD98_20575 [Halomicroarcula sp. F24A]|uniref:Uncharacterized protein n=1 Tax=Haloarcula salinisoli TaxID=2487746 RepID=A0A8J7YML5_9EURY|nr:hypothetical protein [Halomicroarcula salinisoli]